MSNSNFSDTYWNRVNVIASKGVGSKFISSYIKNTTISNCNFSYINLDESKMENVKIEGSKLNNGSMSQCKCKNIIWEKAELEHLNCFKTSLKDMDFTSSNISDIILSDDCSELKGVVVDVYQAVELAKRLGIIIK